MPGDVEAVRRVVLGAGAVAAQLLAPHAEPELTVRTVRERIGDHPGRGAARYGSTTTTSAGPSPTAARRPAASKGRGDAV